MYISTRLRICASISSSIHPDIPQDYGLNIKVSIEISGNVNSFMYLSTKYN